MQEHHPEYLIRTALRYDVLEQALEYTMSLVRRVRFVSLSIILALTDCYDRPMHFWPAVLRKIRHQLGYRML